MSATSSVKSPMSVASTPSLTISNDGSVQAPTQPIPKKSQQIKTDKPRPHICTICTRAFARLEHLKRHERSHTHEKPFQCAACGRCFARRDLVLRHQQKLHASLPNLIRRGSSKDIDTNENIIILHNNTNANAPLPSNGLFDNSNRIQNTGSPNQPQLHSPPKSNEVGLGSKTPQFRTSLFNHASNYSSKSTQSPNSIIPSPLHTNSDQNTPQNHQNSQQHQHHHPQQSQQFTSNSQNDSPNKVLIPKQYPQIPRKQGNHAPTSQQFRHASFSASSATSYTNLKDAMNIQQNNNFVDAPTQVSFNTPQFSATDLSSSKLAMNGIDLNYFDIDWSNMDSLDLNHGTSMRTGPNTNLNDNAKFSQTTNKVKSSKNLDQYFTQNIIASHQFQDPSHPHHIKGMTPFQFGVNPPNDLSLIQSVYSSTQNDSSFKLNGDAIPDNNKRKSLSHDGAIKKQKPDDLLTDESWLTEIINAPYESNFPTPSHQVGFTDSPNSNGTSTNEISSLFRSRQMDLVKQMNPVLFPVFENAENEDLDAFSLKGRDLGNSFITEELRNRILLISNLSNLQFPPLEDVNQYMNLYEKMFDMYFPFIHLPSLRDPMVDNSENIPLILAMLAIGALFSYHDTNSLLLFNLSKFHIHNFFEKEVSLDNLQFKKVPLMAHQCLVLHIYISLFLSEKSLIDKDSKQMKSMVGLILSTKFNKPLEAFLVPPETLNELDSLSIQNNFDYFIMAQSRIRTITMFQMLDAFRSSLLGLPILLASKMNQSGKICMNEKLWKCTNARSWFVELSKTERSESIIELSNNKKLENISEDLRKQNTDFKLSSFNLVALLMNIHEEIEEEIQKASSENLNNMDWGLNVKPKLKDFIKSWEAIFIKSGGLLVINEHNSHILQSSGELKLVLPLYLFAKIRLSLNFSPTMREVLHKNFSKMNEEISLMCQDMDALKEAFNYSLDVIKLWIHNVAVMEDARQTALRTPVFFVTCSFVAIVIISSYIHIIETSKSPSVTDKINWLKCEKLLMEVENIINPVDVANVHSEFFSNQDNMTLRSISSKFDLKSLIDLNAPQEKIVAATKNVNLSTKSLYLGVRILTDAPVWPIAMSFAGALRNRAAFISSKS